MPLVMTDEYDCDTALLYVPANDAIAMRFGGAAKEA